MNESQPFLLEDLGIRGCLVRLHETWQKVVAPHAYPPEIAALLGEGLTATALLASDLKARPSVSLQLHGDGRVKLLLAQCSAGLAVRGAAHRASSSGIDDSAPLLRGGRLVVNVDTGRPNGFSQGIVPIVGFRLDTCLEAYFEQSEQLATRLILRGTADRVGGLLLQVLPGRTEAQGREAFAALAERAQTVATVDLTTVAAATLLPALFPEHAIRLFAAQPIAHDCRCTPERLAGVLRMLGSAELDSLLAEAGHVELTCEFCNRAFRYADADVAAVLRGAAPSAAIH